MTLNPETINELKQKAEQFIEKLYALKALALRDHYYSEDCWYTCPKHSEGCCDDDAGPDCNCGADKHNKRVDELWTEIESLMWG